MIRLATWNMQHLFPVASFDEKWQYLEDVIRPDVAVLTEARFPKLTIPAGWHAQFSPDGIDDKRKWGTAITTRTLELLPLTSISRRFRKQINLRIPGGGATQVSQLQTKNGFTCIVIGIYAPLDDFNGTKTGNGYESGRQILDALTPVLRAHRNVIVAGDLNLLPSDAALLMKSTGLVDLVEYTAASRPILDGCAHCGMSDRCGHMWTHRNKSVPEKRQNIDYVFASKSMLPKVSKVSGGASDFPEVWEFSDHAPVVVDLDV